MNNLLFAVTVALLAPIACAQKSFQFGQSLAPAGVTLVAPADAYSADRGYGFENRSASPLAQPVSAQPDCITADRPFYFSVQLPEGAYLVTVTLGNSNADSTTTVKAEIRRLMLENIHTAPHESATRTFAVNIRRPAYPGGSVRLKGVRESVQEAFAWDDKLTLEFIGAHPAVSAIQIAPAADIPVVYIAGDSTSTDQMAEPYDSWGQMITRFFTAGIAVANHGESGESTSSFFGERRWPKLLSVIKPGDWLLIQFGHNDEKDKGPTAGAFKNFKTNLERMVRESREKGATPILLTPMHRRTFNSAGKITNSHGDYLQAVRTVAREQNVPLIDLADMSKTLYETLGPEKSGILFAGHDTTHHSDYGSYELAKCVLQGIRQDKLPLARFITPDFTGFDPAQPDSFADFKIPAEPTRGPTSRPAGS